MEKAQARELVGVLVAAFRPRDFGTSSEQLYTEILMQFDHAETAKAVRWIVEHDTFFPTIARLRAEAADDYRAPLIDTLDRASLPGYRPEALPGEVAEALAPVIELAVGHAKEHHEPDPHIDYDPVQVARRKAEAKAAAAKERRRLRANGA